MIFSFIITLLSAVFFSLAANSALAVFVFFYAIVILCIEALSIFGVISASNIIIVNFIILFVSIFTWYKTGAKIPQADLKTPFRRIFNSLKLDKSLFVLVICILFMIGVSFWLSLYTPVNEADARGYHFFRSIMFSDLGRISHFATNEIRNLVMPINSEIIYTWIYTFTKNDTAMALLSFFSYFFAAGSIWGILSESGYCVRKKLWAIILFSSLAGIIAQISSTQSDLLTGALLVGCIYYFIKNTKTALFISSLCLALAMGTKSTAIIAMFGIFLFFYLYSKNIRKILLFSGFLALNFLVFSSYNYILNFISFNNFLGSNSALLSHSFWGGIKGAFANFLRYNLQMLDFSGFTWGYFINDSVFGFFNKILSIFNISPNLGANMEFTHLNCFLTEQTMGYGIPGWLVFLPCAICAPILWLKNKNSKKAKILALLGILFFLNLVVMSFSLAYMVFSIRFIGTFVVISAPVLVLSYAKKMNPLKFIIVLFCIFYLTVVSTNLSQRPFFKLKKEFVKHDNVTFNDMARCESFKFYRSDTSECQLRDHILKHYPRGQKIAFFLDSSTTLTSLKFLEKDIYGSYSVDFLNIKNTAGTNLKDYDLIVINNYKQNITTFFNDEKIDFNYLKTSQGIVFTKNEQPVCIYMDKNSNVVFKKEHIAYAKCMTNFDYYKNLGFNKLNIFKPEYFDYDKEMVQTYFIFSKQRQSDIITLQ